jgi:hypothetical protein
MEYSGRGRRMHTHCLVVPPEILLRFANHPFAIARAAIAAGTMEVREEVPRQLESLELPGRAAAVDQSRLSQLAAQIGPRRLALLVQAALVSPCMAVGGVADADRLIAGVLDCLPPECRTEISFSTGLKFSSRRPFRVVALPGDAAERRWLSRQRGVTVLDLAEEPRSVAVEGWPALIQRAAASGRLSFLAAELSKPRCGLTLGDLPALGLQLLEELEAATVHGPGKPVVGGLSQFSFNRAPSEGWSEAIPCRDADPSRAHAAHRRFEKSADCTATVSPAPAGPSQCLKSDLPQIQEKLETLDDAVFEALSGQTRAVEQLKLLWPALRAELGEDLLAESREQYLRYGLSIWQQCVDAGAIRDPSRAVQALEVLCVLFDDV